MRKKAPEHCAKFPTEILTEIADIVRTERAILGRTPVLLDPFAGIGGIHGIADVLEVDVDTHGIELEKRWADYHPRTKVGDATKLPHKTGTVDVIATSPCLEQSHRVLTDDLRWVAVGDLLEGDRVLAFDESGREGATGQNARRRWQRAEVVRSVPRTVECVRVVLANGDELVTTPDHPWLAYRYAYGGRAAEWVASKDLAGRPGVGRGGKGLRRQSYVMLQVRPWTQRRSFGAGWLSGMYDGEGSLAGGTHGCPKLQLTQVEGPVLDRAESLMHEFGYPTNLIWRTGVPNRQKVGNLYVNGGFPGILTALGELRPVRLLEKWAALDISQRTVQAELVEVVAVEPAGRRQIQEIETTSGTYIGEGYLHHNCYGNRMGDTYDGSKDRCIPCKKAGVVAPDCPECGGTGFKPSRRMTYTISHGSPLQPNNAGAMQYGSTPATRADYQRLHRAAMVEMARVLRPREGPKPGDDPGGLAIINISNHVRDGKEMYVVEWYLTTLIELGFKFIAGQPVETRRNRNGANGELRVEAEQLLIWRAPVAGQQVLV